MELVLVGSKRACVSPGCVADHNTITDLGAIIGGELHTDTSFTIPSTGAPNCAASADNCAGITEWNQAMVLDNGSEVYFENNTFVIDSNTYYGNMVDCQNGDGMSSAITR